jgi:hypothetical protein
MKLNAPKSSNELIDMISVYTEIKAIVIANEVENNANPFPGLNKLSKELDKVITKSVSNKTEWITKKTEILKEVKKSISK